MLEPLGDVTIVSVETGGETLRMVLPEARPPHRGLRPDQPASIIHRSKQVFTSSAPSSGQAMT